MMDHKLEKMPCGMVVYTDGRGSYTVSVGSILKLTKIEEVSCTEFMIKDIIE